MVKKVFLTVFSVIVLAFAYGLFPATTPIAQAAKCKTEAGLTIVSIKPWYSGVCKPGTDDVEIKSIPGDIIIIALNLLSIAIQIAGYAAVTLVIWGGIKYILASGEASKIASAKTTIQNALIGLLIVLVAITLVDFVTDLYK